MNFCGPYRDRKILNVRPKPRNTFSISWPLYGSRKFISRSSDKKTVYVTTGAGCIILASATFDLNPKGHTRREWFISRPWCIMYYFQRGNVLTSYLSNGSDINPEGLPITLLRWKFLTAWLSLDYLKISNYHEHH